MMNEAETLDPKKQNTADIGDLGKPLL